MRLGGTLFRKFDDADGWVAAVQHYGYRAAYCPVDSDAELGATPRSASISSVDPPASTA